jgi:hypothetical protein
MQAPGTVLLSGIAVGHHRRILLDRWNCFMIQFVHQHDSLGSIALARRRGMQVHTPGPEGRQIWETPENAAVSGEFMAFCPPPPYCRYTKNRHIPQRPFWTTWVAYPNEPGASSFPQSRFRRSGTFLSHLKPPEFKPCPDRRLNVVQFTV